MRTPSLEDPPAQVAHGAAGAPQAAGQAWDGLLLTATAGVCVVSLFAPFTLPAVQWLVVVIVVLAFVVLPPARAVAQAAAAVLLTAIVTVFAVVRGADPVPAVFNWLALTAGLALISAALWRRYRAVDRRARVAEAQAQLGRQALSVTDPDDLLRAALTSAVAMVGADFGTAARGGPGGPLTVAAETGPGARPRGAVVPLPAAGPAMVSVMTNGLAWTSADLRTDPRATAPDPMVGRGASVVAVPLTGLEGVVGVLTVYRQRPRRFRPADVAVLESLAAIAVTAWEQLRHHEQLSHQALHDPLTGLPNRVLLLDRLDHALSRRPGNRSGASGTAVALIDLDLFKSVNDGLGHAAGDAVLREVGQRLAAAVRAEDTVARFGGDEFALLCTAVPDEQIAVGVARRLLQACSQPLAVDGVIITVTASVGITMTSGPPGTSASAETLLREADAALYRAKDRGGDRVEMFNRRMQEQTQARLRMESALRGAIDRDELTLHYLPIRATADQRVLGVEALVRWQHPNRGLLSPEEFLPLAEASGLIMPIGDWVLRNACAQVAQWQQASVPSVVGPLRLAINTSARELEDPQLATRIIAAIDDSALAAGTLTLEVPESALVAAGDTAGGAWSALAGAGVTVTVDDFGAGYTSLTRLAGLPLEALKISRSLVSRLDRDPRDPVVAAAVALGGELGATVVADGVQTVAQLTALRDLGCPAVQGFLLDRPTPVPHWQPGGALDPSQPCSP